MFIGLGSVLQAMEGLSIKEGLVVGCVAIALFVFMIFAGIDEADKSIARANEFKKYMSDCIERYSASRCIEFDYWDRRDLGLK